MNWNELLTSQIEYIYPVTDKLMAAVDDDQLDWKPATGENWMTGGQLLMHISCACGACFKGFVTGDWGALMDVDSESSPEDMLPPAEKLPTVGSVAEARKLLGDDKQLALDMLARCNEEDLTGKVITAPWDQTEMILGPRLLQMIDHLAQHKGQLYYYLKLQGKAMDSSHLWGM